MAQREQAVIGVFRVEIIVRPVAVEPALGVPECVDEVEAALVDDAGNPALDAAQGVQGRGCGEKVRQRRSGNREEPAFRKWVKDNKVPFDPDAKGPQDYDMRGFWKALQAGDEKAKSGIDPNDGKLHYPDYWKTPYHETFSAESQ